MAEDLALAQRLAGALRGYGMISAEAGAPHGRIGFNVAGPEGCAAQDPTGWAAVQAMRKSKEELRDVGAVSC